MIIKAIKNDRVDMICYRTYGELTSAGMSGILRRNPDLPAVIPAFTEVDVPDEIPSPVSTRAYQPLSEGQ